MKRESAEFVDADREETCPSATLSAINFTWTDPGWNPDVGIERPATIRLTEDGVPKLQTNILPPT